MCEPLSHALGSLPPLQLALLANSALGTLIWWLFYGVSARASRNVPRLSERADPAPPTWPTVSVVVPARDEAADVADTLQSLLHQPYDQLQVIAVDDRSTDRTGAIIAELAANDPRLLPIRVDTLPTGWLGKVHALRVGSAEATGDLLLFCDADIHHEPGLLRRAVAVMEAEELDLLTLLPKLRGRGIMVPLMAAFADGYVARTLGRRGLLTRAGSYFGLGTFMLVRRSALARTAGFPWLKLDALDDLALAKLLSDSGARCAFAVADDLLSIEWYPSVSAFAHNTEKNFWGGMAGYSWARCLAMASMAGSVFLAPFLGLFAGTPIALALLVAAWLPVVVAALASRRFVGRTFGMSLLNPFAQLLLAGVMARAALVSIGRTHIDWRGTRYSVDDLRKGRRVSYP